MATKPRAALFARVSTLAAFGLLFAGAALVLAQQTGAPSAEAVLEALAKEDLTTIFASVEGSTVILEGKVRNVFEKNDAVAIALAQPGVEAVEADVEVGAAESDQKLGEEVVRQVRRYSRLSVFDDVNAAVEDGRVALLGFVTEPYKKTEIEQRLHDVIGIQEFENQIEVLPTSTSDDRLRRALANRLYRDSLFSDFASMAVPPVRIIVKRSRVLLTGVVNSRLAKQKAASIARQTPGVLSVENRLRIGN